MTGIQRFFLICAGSDLSILKRTPTEINKHTGIGATIFFTGLFAALAGGFATFTVFNSYIAAVFVACFWGAMIFNLDRYIVSSMKMNKSVWRNYASAIPRLILAIIIAIVIAKPLELKIFDTEIRSEIALMQQENIKAQEDLLASRFQNDIIQTKADIQLLKDEILLVENKRDQLDAIAIQEADGTGGSQLRNMGPIYRAKKQDALKAQSELDALLATNTPLIEEKQNALQELNSRKETEMSALEKVSLTGFAARLEALHRLSNKSQAIWLASIFIMLLFIAIETTPIFVKLISSRSPYDYVLDKHEHVFAMNHQLKTSTLKQEVENKVHFDSKVGRYKTELAINTEKKIIKEALEESYDELKAGTKKWGNIFGKSSVFDF